MRVVSIFLTDSSRGAWEQAFTRQGMILEPVLNRNELMRQMRQGFALVALIGADETASAPDCLRTLRQVNAEITAIVVTKLTCPNRRAAMFHAGADDVVSPSCDAMELLARINAVQRRGGRVASSSLVFGEAALDVASHELLLPHDVLELTRMECAFLRILFLRKGATVEKRVLVEQLHRSESDADSRALDVLVCKLRKKLAAHGAASLIGTVWGSGYRLQHIRSTVAQIGLNAA